MNPPEKLKNGSTCPKCGAGTMTLEARMPIRRRPGMSELYFRCTACRVVVKQVEDDRFRE